MSSTRPIATPQTPSAGARWPRIALRVASLVALLAGLHYGGEWIVSHLEQHLMPLYRSYGALALTVATVVYIAAMAMPFVPGIEISLALIMLYGAPAAMLVYAATVLALSGTFLAGRLLPASALARLFDWLSLHRAAALVRRLEPLAPDARLGLLLELAPTRVVPFLLRHRYLALAVAFNLPGNALLGGGGGIALAAGLSGLFRWPLYVLWVALAVAPIPLAVVLRSLLRAG